MSAAAGPADWTTEQVVAWFGTIEGVDPAVADAVRENEIVSPSSLSRSRDIAQLPLDASSDHCAVRRPRLCTHALLRLSYRSEV